MENLTDHSTSWYGQFSPFSWGWTRRRTLLLGAVAAPVGVMFGVVHGLYAHSPSEGLAVGWRAVLAALLTVGLGPALATAARRQHWDLHTERSAVVAAVLLGTLASFAARLYAEDFHDQLMRSQLTRFDRLWRLFSGQWPLHSLVENMTTLFVDVGVHAVGSGLLALREYFGEPRRLRDAAARREMDALRRQKLVAEAKLSVLQAQVEPHFLFNTLACVQAEIESHPDRARTLVQALAHYLRAALPQLRHDGPAAAATLRDQFELCRGYLEVMQQRLGDRLKVTVELDDDLGTLPFPSLLMLSLVENAVTHGVEPAARPVRIAMRAHRLMVADRDWLEVCVEDDGVGLPDGLVEGTGTSNIRSQLAALFGADAQIYIESPGSGVRATIRILFEALLR